MKEILLQLFNIGISMAVINHLILTVHDEGDAHPLIINYLAFTNTIHEHLHLLSGLLLGVGTCNINPLFREATNPMEYIFCDVKYDRNKPFKASFSIVAPIFFAILITTGLTYLHPVLGVIAMFFNFGVIGQSCADLIVLKKIGGRVIFIILTIVEVTLLSLILPTHSGLNTIVSILMAAMTFICNRINLPTNTPTTKQPTLPSKQKLNLEKEFNIGSGLYPVEKESIDDFINKISNNPNDDDLDF